MQYRIHHFGHFGGPGTSKLVHSMCFCQPCLAIYARVDLTRVEAWPEAVLRARMGTGAVGYSAFEGPESTWDPHDRSTRLKPKPRQGEPTQINKPSPSLASNGLYDAGHLGSPPSELTLPEDSKGGVDPRVPMLRQGHGQTSTVRFKDGCRCLSMPTFRPW